MISLIFAFDSSDPTDCAAVLSSSTTDSIMHSSPVGHSSDLDRLIGSFVSGHLRQVRRIFWTFSIRPPLSH